MVPIIDVLIFVSLLVDATSILLLS